MKNTEVTIEKWYSQEDKNKFWYWIVGQDGEGIDGFRLKSHALQAIINRGFKRVNLNIKERR